MGTKLLFILGIVLTHGALGAVWMSEVAPQPSAPVTSCVKTPVPLPYFEPQREILAMLVAPTHSEEHQQP
jgi:hypothetical protein